MRQCTQVHSSRGQHVLAWGCSQYPRLAASFSWGNAEKQGSQITEKETKLKSTIVTAVLRAAWSHGFDCLTKLLHR
jgi:hypothetical protein